MDNIKITILHSGLASLSIKPDTNELGSQYDNMAKQLVFWRPEEFKDDSLILRFKDRNMTFESIDLGTLNEFPLTNTFTRWDRLSLQIAFMRDGGEIAHSNIAEFTLRPSIDNGGASAPAGDAASRTYVDTQDAKTLAAAKAYADEHGGGGQGPKGDKGDPGEKGEKGDKGDKGEPGSGSGVSELTPTTPVFGIPDGKLLGVSGGKVAGFDALSGAEVLKSFVCVRDLNPLPDDSGNGIGKIKSISAGENPLTATKLYSYGQNLINDKSINLSAGGLTVAFVGDRIVVNGTSTGQVRVKLTGTPAISTLSYFPTAWGTETPPFSDKSMQLYYSRFNVSGAPSGITSYVYYQGEAGSPVERSFVMVGEAKSRVDEIDITKKIACIILRMNAGTYDNFSFNISLSTRQVNSINYLPGELNVVDLPAVEANATVAADISVPMQENGVITYGYDQAVPTSANIEYPVVSRHVTWERNVSGYLRSVTPEWDNVVPKYRPQIAGYRANFIGSSSTANVNSFPDISSWLGRFDVMRRYGVGGATVARRDGVTTSLVETYPKMNLDANLVVIQVSGINDHGENTPMGEITSADDTTFLGALRSVFTGVYDMFPSARVVCLSPFPNSKAYSANSLGKTLHDYNAALIESCKYHFVPYINVYDDFGFYPSSPAQRAIWLPDTVHPSTRGYTRVALLLLDSLERLCQ